METFFLGTHDVSWLRKTDVPLFISRRRLEKLKRLPKARGPYAIDSGGFTELSQYGAWTITVDQYIAEVRRCADCVGMPVFASQMDHMVEPSILQKTGKTVEAHQRLTIRNYLELMEKAPDLPWMPVLQGWSIGEYWTCAELYEKAGVQLAALPRVGLGSVCRRQATTRIGALVATLKRVDNLSVHTFGAKIRGLALFAADIVSSDSLAWSFNARKHPPLKECAGAHAHCGNCIRWALRWRSKVMRLLGKDPGPAQEPPVQGMLF